jgi:diguanylate cyclase (GGDEF)-like protein
MNQENVVVGAAKIFDATFIQEDVSLRLKELGKFAYLDALTSIPNRRYMEEILKDWLEPGNRRNRNFAVSMGDIDFFKNVNDKHGHDTGDLVLKKIASTLRSNLRTSDVVGRWGGEEFLILLQHVSYSQASAKLESLRKAIELSPVESGGGCLKVTMSFGCSLPRKGDNPSSIVTRADEYLYKSKREGRNRVSIEEEP